MPVAACLKIADACGASALDDLKLFGENELVQEGFKVNSSTVRGIVPPPGRGLIMCGVHVYVLVDRVQRVHARKILLGLK